jgi:hypothetical protein
MTSFKPSHFCWEAPDCHFAKALINYGPIIGDKKTITLFWGNLYVGQYWVADPEDAPAVNDDGIVTLYGDTSSVWMLQIEMGVLRIAVDSDAQITAIQYDI